MPLPSAPLGWYLHEARRLRDENACKIKQPRGWRCVRDMHPENQPCACVPKWWNLKAWVAA